MPPMYTSTHEILRPDTSASPPDGSVVMSVGLTPRAFDLIGDVRHVEQTFRHFVDICGEIPEGVPLCMDFIGNAQYLGEDFHVHCERADLMIRDRQAWIAEDGQVRRIENVEPDSNPTIGFLDLLDGRSGNIAPFSCAVPVFNLTEAILESSRTGRNVPAAG